MLNTKRAVFAWFSEKTKLNQKHVHSSNEQEWKARGVMQRGETVKGGLGRHFIVLGNGKLVVVEPTNQKGKMWQTVSS